MKKLFTLLTLALLSIGSAWAEDATIFSYTVEEVPEGQSVQVYTYNATGTIGGTCDFNVTATSGNAGFFQTTSNIVNYNFGTNSAYVKVTLANSETFKTGDVVTVSGYCANDNYASRGFYISTNNGTENQIATSNFPNRSVQSNSLTATLDANYNGVSTFYIKRNGGCCFIGVTVKRAVVDLESPTCTTSQTTEAATIGTPLNLTVNSTHYTSLQWYKAENSNLSDAAAISGATLTTYSYTAVPADANKTYYFYCVATNDNATGTKTAQSSTITVNVGSYTASTACELTKIMFSNGFDGFIKLGDTDNTITAYYMSGESAPTITSATVSDGATYNLSGSTFTVTAEDGTTTKDFTVSLTAVSPMSEMERTFDGTEGWVKTGGAFNPGDKIGWTINKNTEENSNRRITEGKNRIYFFVENASKITLYPSTTNGSNRNVTVTINNGAGESKSFPKYAANAKLEITTGAKAMVGITNLGSGDLCIGSITVDGLANPTIAVSTKADRNYASYITSQKLDFGSAEDITAYIATGFNGAKDAIVLQPVDVVDAGTPIIVKTETKGATVNVPVTTADASSTAGNALVPGDGTTAWNGTAGYTYYYIANDQFYKATSGTLKSGKAYLKVDNTEVPAPVLNFVFGDVTGIADVRSKMVDVRGDFFDLQGRKVAQPKKGLYIVNGKKVIIK